MSINHLINYESTERILNALLNGAEDISSASSETKYLTTRISNQIVGLRKSGIKIETKTVKVPSSNKFYGRYVLVKDKENIENAISLLEELENRRK
ncbi:helix-turn-helix domain-containing protein [Aliarcobacter cryaerophilus]|uniref:helix-turn-helix domain-containing protein n=1 Tax=Aliarcobacter cryaerophilus TaxID=28198 RepID=UPI0021B2E4A2|nr:helix-turn-helix domain-containing protein [Aliarcobacter cryaerophilus]MCT7505518.1 helix-turn-helix domain-containing protein [Aliarcobacter cryaerophilus]